MQYTKRIKTNLEKMLKLIIDEVAILSNMDKKEKALAAK